MGDSRIIASVAGDGGVKVTDRVLGALEDGADLVELRLDTLSGGCLAELGDALRRVPAGVCLLTCRSAREGGSSQADAVDRWRQVAGLLCKQVAAVDVEQFDIEAEPSLRGLLDGRGTATTLIVSSHRYSQSLDDPEGVLRAMESVMPDCVAKVAWSCSDVSDNFRALEAMRAKPGRRIVICMGEKGLPSRVLAAKCGAWGSFAAADGGHATAPGQVTVEDMVSRYGWRRQDADTQVFGVIGSPVAQSMSPLIFNDQFQAAGINAVYLPILIDSAEELCRFLAGCCQRPWLNVCGFSVTAPHKGAALAWAGGRVEPLAARIGAANTLCLGGAKCEKGKKGESALAFNTDYLGALAALESAVRTSDLTGVSVAVLGAGGVARSLVAGLSDRGAKVTIYNRSKARGRDLSDTFGMPFADWDSRSGLTDDVIVNCTSVGMAPDAGESPMPKRAFRSSMTVFDTVYNPVETVLLRDAREAGCRVVDGVEMFVQQAAAQYGLWTGQRADIERMRRVVLAELRRRGVGGEADGPR